MKEIDEQIEDWQPEPLVAELTEEDIHELERRPVIVGYVQLLPLVCCPH